MAEISRRLFLGVTGSALAGAAGLYPTRAEAAGTVADCGGVAMADGVVMLENDVLRVGLTFTAGSLRLTRRFNKGAAPHTTYYVPNMLWKSTRGALSPLPEDTSSSGKRAELPKKAITVYDTGHGWSVSPELNWKTIRGKGNVPTDFMLAPFASIDAW